MDQNEGFFVNCPGKCFAIPEKLRIAVCGSVCGAKLFQQYLPRFSYLSKKIVSVNSELNSAIVIFFHIKLVYGNFLRKDTKY